MNAVMLSFSALKALPAMALASLMWRAARLAGRAAPIAIYAIWAIWQLVVMALVHWIAMHCSFFLTEKIFFLLEGGPHTDLSVVDHLLHVGLMADLALGIILTCVGFVAVKIGQFMATASSGRAEAKAREAFKASRASFDAAREAEALDAGLPRGAKRGRSASRL